LRVRSKPRGVDAAPAFACRQASGQVCARADIG
jgi:hypothetical protein